MTTRARKPCLAEKLVTEKTISAKKLVSELPAEGVWLKGPVWHDSCYCMGAGCRVQSAGCRVQGAGCRVQGAADRD